MFILGRTTHSIEDSPPLPFELRELDERIPKGVFVHMRLLPKQITEQMLRPARKIMRKDGEAFVEDQEKALSKWLRDHVSKALVDTSGGFGWSFIEPSAVKAYASLLPGQDLSAALLDGNWSEDFKAKFLEERGDIAGLFLKAYGKLSEIGVVQKAAEDEKKEPTSQNTSPSD